MMTENELIFPDNFLFGSGTSAYQIEGGCNADGKGSSIWDTFCQKRGTIRFGHTGDIACDHYHLYRDDVALMKSLGLNTYRFSISWPRIFPTGKGTINPQGLDFYDRLVDSLVEAGIDPFVTLFHWDLPKHLQRTIGGFGNRQCVDYFTDYAIAVTEKLKDRVKHWITINEPWVYAMPGVLFGTHAPGKRNPWAAFRTIHHLLLAHATAMKAIKSIDTSLQVGIVLNLMPIFPMTDIKKDRDAADTADLFYNRIQLDPLFKGSYPEKLMKKLRLCWPKIHSGDLEQIGTPSDFLGVNYYTCARAYHKWYVPLLHAWMTGATIPEKEFEKDGIQHTAMGWEVYPKGIYEILMRLKQAYGNPPVYITENGAAFEDHLENGSVHDPKRLNFLRAHLENVHQALRDGTNVKGYFAWSLLDNFEWSVGFSKRFGIVYVDYENQKRYVKDSGLWYADLIKRQH